MHTITIETKEFNINGMSKWQSMATRKRSKKYEVGVRLAGTKKNISKSEWKKIQKERRKKLLR